MTHSSISGEGEIDLLLVNKRSDREEAKPFGGRHLDDFD